MSSSFQPVMYNDPNQNSTYSQIPQSQDMMFRSVQNNYNPSNSNKIPFYKSALFIGIVVFFIVAILGLFVYLYYKKKEPEAESNEQVNNNSSPSNPKTSKIVSIYASGGCLKENSLMETQEKFDILDEEKMNIISNNPTLKLKSERKLDDYKFNFELNNNSDTFYIDFINDGKTTDGCDKTLYIRSKVKIDGNEKSINIVRETNNAQIGSISAVINSTQEQWFKLPWGGIYKVSISK